MILEFIFPESGSGAPTLVFREGEKISRCRRPRWVQLFALMVHRDQCGLGQRFVTAGDLEYLMACKRTSLQSSVKWFTNTAPRLPALMKEFIRDYTSIKHGGPYRLRFAPVDILVDLELLKEYVRLIYIPPKSEPLHDDTLLLDILRSANAAANSFDIETSQILYNACLRSVDSTASLPTTYKSLTYDHLAELEFLLHGHTGRMHQLYRLGQRAAMKLKSSQDRRLTLAYNLSSHLFHFPRKLDNVREVLNLNQNVIDLAKELPRWSSDRASILMKAYYLRATLVTQFALKENAKTETDTIKDSLMILEDDRARTFTPAYTAETLAFMTLNLKLLKGFQHHEKVTADDLSQYRKLLFHLIPGEANTIGLVERIAQNYMQSNDFKGGLEFLSDALGHHSCLQQFHKYQRVQTIQEEILAKVR